MCIVFRRTAKIVKNVLVGLKPYKKVYTKQRSTKTDAALTKTMNK